MKEITHEKIWEAILKQMRTLLAEKGMTQAKIADKMGVDKGTVTRWLSGKRQGSKSNPEVIIGYMQALDMNPLDFFMDERGGSLDYTALLQRIEKLEGTITELRDMISLQNETIAAQKESLRLYREREGTPLRNSDDVGSDAPTSIPVARLSRRENE